MTLGFIEEDRDFYRIKQNNELTICGRKFNIELQFLVDENK